MTNLLDVFAFSSVILRALALSFQSLLIGGIAFQILLQYRVRSVPESEQILSPIRLLMRITAVGLAITQFLFVSTNSAVLMDTAGFGLREVAGANYFIAGLVSAISALLLARYTTAQGRSLMPQGLLLPLILISSVVTSHAWARIDHRALLTGFTLLHHLAAGLWIGALPFLLIALRCGKQVATSSLIARNFSSMAASSVAVVLIAGSGLTFLYMDSPTAFYGTSYGAMVGAKIWLVAGILAIGALNFTIVRSLSKDPEKGIRRLRWLVEAEIGLGFTAIFAAASLASLPPAVDLPTGRVTASDLVQRFRPRLPRFQTPALSELGKSEEQLLNQEADNRGAPSSYVPGAPSFLQSTPGDIAWSEYNHHWAGMIVFFAGLLALASRSSKIRWAGNWPLLFLGLAVFLFLRADAENWPLGPNGFWESFRVAEVLQHRFFTLLIVGFAIFEWRIHSGRDTAAWMPYIFPAVCALGGAVLLTHSHSLSNVKEATLIEISHIPIAIFAVFAGWTRWLELRVGRPNASFLSWLWPLCFVVIGSTLMLYREA